jgi:hypothetical protein
MFKELIMSWGINKLKLIAALTMVLMFALAAPALADTVYVDVDWGNSTQGHNVEYRFYGNKNNTGTYEFDLLIDDMAKKGYCADLQEGLHDGYMDNTPSPDSLAFLEAAYIMQTWAPGLGNDPEAGYSVADVVTAVQIAIWEVTYDTNHDLYVGDFKIGYYWYGDTRMYSGNNSNAVTLAQNYLDSIPSNLTSALFPGYGTVVSDEGGEWGSNQNLVYGGTSGGPAVPEPTSMLLFASALGAGGWYRRRMKKKEKAEAEAA